jgi:hypothetical protein
LLDFVATHLSGQCDDKATVPDLRAEVPNRNGSRSGGPTSRERKEGSLCVMTASGSRDARTAAPTTAEHDRYQSPPGVTARPAGILPWAKIEGVLVHDRGHALFIGEVLRKHQAPELRAL